MDGCRPRSLHVDALPNTDQIYPPSVELVGDIGAIARRCSRPARRRAAGREAEVRRIAAAARGVLLGPRHRALNPTDVVDVVRGAIPATRIATTDVGSHKLLVGTGLAHAPSRDAC